MTIVGVVLLLAALTQAAYHRARRPDVVGRLEGRSRHATSLRWREPPGFIKARAADVELPVALEDLWRWWRLAAPAAFVLGWLAAGPVLAVIALVASIATPIAALHLVRSRAEAAYDNELVLALDAVARGLRAGGSIGQAVTEAAPAVRGLVEQDIRRVGADAARGQTLVAALDEWRERRPRHSVELAVGALALAVDTGGPPARVIEEIAAALRQQLQIEAEARAMGAQARMSAVVVGLAPVGFALLTSATDERNAHLLFGTPLGVACVVLGITLDGIGAVWMHRISESVVS